MYSSTSPAYIPPIYQVKEREEKKDYNLSSDVKKYIESVINQKISNENIQELFTINQGEIIPQGVNKEYVDNLALTIFEQLNNKINKNIDVDFNHYKIKNLQLPTDSNDAATKGYVDEKFDLLHGYSLPIQHIFSKGQNLIKKTFFFNPGFICPQKIHITSVGFSTSPYKYNISEKQKFGELNPTKLYFMINNEIKSEWCIEKDIRIGHVLKDFETPLLLEKGDNLMLVVESIIEDASVNITFY